MGKRKIDEFIVTMITPATPAGWQELQESASKAIVENLIIKPYQNKELLKTDHFLNK